jgi:protoporphyrinogen/coproporphyrinogen III oxidase
VKRVAIIGSGVSACACGVALKEEGVDFTIFEKEASPGGKLLTEFIDGLLVEGGPDSFLPEKYWTVDLIRKVGLEEELLCTNDQFKGTYIYSGGRLHRLPEGVMLMVPTMIMPLLKSSLISWPGKIRMGLEFFLPPKKETTDESLAQFVTRRLGKECLEKIAEPLVAGIHTSNPDNMSILAIFPRFVEMEKKYGSLIKGMLAAMKKVPPSDPSKKKMTYFMSLKGGMQQLTDACVNVIGKERIRTSSEISRVLKTQNGYRLAVVNRSDANGQNGPRGQNELGTVQEEVFDDLVLTTPAYVTSELVHEMDPELAGRLLSMDWSSTATISIAFKKKDIKVKLPGFGFIVPKVANRRINATTWSSIKWPFRAPDDYLLLRSFIGGGHHEELVSDNDEMLVSTTLEELRHIVGIDATPVFSKVYRWIKGMPKYTVGHLERLARIDELRTRHPGFYLIGCSYRGIGIGDCVKSGFDAASEIAKS